ncbi:hypothetical protein Lepto7375DRAFT_7218 [Leptolyngbya sp. PCC 7375]|nr:hypothetical protein Lepto7375DRAFT_7218 [Leptolyngbya sp. PCC 7375]
MTVHQIAFRLNDENPYEASVLELLSQYPHENHHQTAKAIVCVYVKQGFEHPTVNPFIGQNYYIQSPAVRTEPIPTPQPVSPISPMVEESYMDTPSEPMTTEGIGAIEPISFNFGN